MTFHDSLQSYNSENSQIIYLYLIFRSNSIVGSPSQARNEGRSKEKYYLNARDYRETWCNKLLNNDAKN